MTNQLPPLASIQRSYTRVAPLTVFAGVLLILLLTPLLRAEPGAKKYARHQQTFLKRTEAGENFSYIPITRDGDWTVATDPATGNILRRGSDATDVIEWSLTMADVTILRDGVYEMDHTLEIPRSNVTLIIDKNAQIKQEEAAKDDRFSLLTRISEGRGRGYPLIRVKNRDHVHIINLGTIGSSKHPPHSAITFDGRNGGKTGIHGGGIISTGTLNAHAAIWLVDTANIEIPVLVGGQEIGNALLVMEGAEDSKLGFIAGLMGGAAEEDETIDVNNYNRNTQIDTVLGWVPDGTKDEIIDINSSPNTKVKRVVAYGPHEGTRLTHITGHAEWSRRLTQKKYISHSNGTNVEKEEFVTKPVKEWIIKADTPGFPDRLPEMTIDVSVTVAFEDGSSDQVFQRNVTLNLDKTGK